MEKKYILLSLDDKKTKRVAEAISNNTCKKILGLLTEKDLTEKEISIRLDIPINTVEYNLKKLIDSGLVESSSHYWSVKGRKMHSYKLSNKKIIISPKSSYRIIPIMLMSIITGFASIGLKSIKQVKSENLKVFADVSQEIMFKSVDSTPLLSSNVQWFLWGMILFLFVYSITKLFEKRMKGG